MTFYLLNIFYYLLYYIRIYFRCKFEHDNCASYFKYFLRLLYASVSVIGVNTFCSEVAVYVLSTYIVLEVCWSNWSMRNVAKLYLIKEWLWLV